MLGSKNAGRWATLQDVDAVAGPVRLVVALAGDAPFEAPEPRPVRAHAPSFVHARALVAAAHPPHCSLCTIPNTESTEDL